MKLHLPRIRTDGGRIEFPSQVRPKARPSSAGGANTCSVTPEGQAELRGHLQVDITDIPAGPGSIESMYEEYLSIPETVKRAHELQADGWDGILLGCYGDPGLGALREIVDIPVVGAGQATALMASAVGRRYSVITVTDSVIGPLEETMRNSGGGDKLASVRAVNIPVLELHRDREQAIEVTLEEGKKAIEEDRADTLIVGCMSMGFLEIPEACQAELGVPFLNPARVQLKFLEAMLGSGLSHSKQAYMTPRRLPPDKRRARLISITARTSPPDNIAGDCHNRKFKGKSLTLSTRLNTFQSATTSHPSLKHRGGAGGGVGNGERNGIRTNRRYLD